MSDLGSGNVTEIVPPFSISVDKDGHFTMTGGTTYLAPETTEVKASDVLKAALKMMAYLAERQMEQQQ